MSIWPFSAYLTPRNWRTFAPYPIMPPHAHTQITNVTLHSTISHVSTISHHFPAVTTTTTILKYMGILSGRGEWPFHIPRVVHFIPRILFVCTNHPGDSFPGGGILFLVASQTVRHAISHTTSLSCPCLFLLLVVRPSVDSAAPLVN